jgi:MoxR-like ATPase
VNLSTPPAEIDLAAIGSARERLLSAIGQTIVGQEIVVDTMLTALFSNGHAIFVGVPGLAKTMLVRMLASAVGVKFSRIQFTPDLMPSDITGTQMLDEDPETGKRRLRFVPGPIFTNLLLADEINRTPPKTQAALLEALSERSVTAAGETHYLDQPFLAFATQNPIEQEGTYPLPEAATDRFMFSIPVGYPSAEEEMEIVRRTVVGTPATTPEVLSAHELVEMQKLIRNLPITDDVIKTCVRLTTATRPASGGEAARWLRWGAGPRATQFLAMGARTHAALRGEEVATVDDVFAVAVPVLRHRLVLNFEASAEGVDADDVVRTIIERIAR